jgi:hypothetical protein
LIDAILCDVACLWFTAKNYTARWLNSSASAKASAFLTTCDAQLFGWGYRMKRQIMLAEAGEIYIYDL